jgi:hypothetical protein
MGSIRGRLYEFVEAAGHRHGAMLQRRQPPFGVEAEPQVLLRCSAMSHGSEHLVAGQGQLDRPPKHPRRQNTEDLRTGQDRLRSEATAQKWAAQQHVLGRNAEERRKSCPRHQDRLVRGVDGQPVAVPFCNDGMRLHCIVILGRRLVFRLDQVRGRAETGSQVAAIEIGR